MHKTHKVSVWPVAFAARLKYEGPECKDGVVSAWHVDWGAERCVCMTVCVCVCMHA